jgi:hypothetical protein
VIGFYAAGAMGSGGSPGGWTPADLSPAEWWDFSDGSTLTLASGAVSAIASKGSGGRSASQGTAAARPTLSSVNGLSAALFDGSNDVLNLSSSLPTGSTPNPLTIAQVFTRPSSGIVSQIMGGGTSTPPWTTQWWTDNVTYIAPWSGSFATMGSADTRTGTFVDIIVKGASSTTLYRNGSTVASVSNVAGSGGLSLIGSRGTTRHNGAICEIVYLYSAVSGTDLANLTSYLMSKWGV